MGLFLSKGIAEQHHGSLRGTSNGLGCGSTFTLTLPLIHVPVPTPENDPNGDSQYELSALVGAQPTTDGSDRAATDLCKPMPMKILVVDDAPINLKLLIKLLERNGHSCDAAIDGQECVDMVVKATQEGWRYDTILLDYQMRKSCTETAAAMSNDD